ncbi:DUF1499 domain-containing protein [Amphritea sp. 1_MG-2023]|uniref:DUF1499 domain-containing protein n=1 Tax=Amphritea sp. 1_MG-2023 TaxID=3062670 RepID=UPI0026E25300|nr:DUF1499 domain-containing protein [Amphritea sp. 1_MG-2023]MDO6563155.1 DUF1499 domain-containing protein [Amphritea sp. 1_MG-2023]
MKSFLMLAGSIVIISMMLVTGYLVLQGIKSREQTPPGLVNGELTPCGMKPNAVCSRQSTDQAHYIAPIRWQGESLTPVLKIIEHLGGRVVSQDADYIAAVFSSKLFGFVDDLELLHNQAEGVIQVRAAARVGYSDMGVNRQRVEALRQYLEQQE